MSLPAPHTVHRIAGWKDVNLHVPEWGTPTGQPILLVHGWSQAHVSWARQLDGSLDGFRLIAPDLRGHGLSDKPDAPEHYNTGAPWAGDIKAIIDTLDLSDVVLVGWSMGGWVVQDYLRAYGDSKVAGYSLVGSSSATGTFSSDAAREKRKNDTAVRANGMYGDDLAANLEATVAFLHACFHQQPDADDLAVMAGFNMLCPPYVRAPARKRHEDYGPDLAKLSVPALVQWGVHERLAVEPMPQDTLAALPNARGIIYADSGHAPFWEEADRFNADLKAFAAQVQAVPA